MFKIFAQMLSNERYELFRKKINLQFQLIWFHARTNFDGMAVSLENIKLILLKLCVMFQYLIAYKLDAICSVKLFLSFVEYKKLQL
jgi:hypothetical protein